MSIIVNSLSYAHPNRESLFQTINLAIPMGEKAALVGNNGAGKSTLLRLIAGLLQPSEGEIILAEKTYYVPQHTNQYDTYSIAQVLGVGEKLRALYAILDGDASTDNFLLLNDEWDIEERVSVALSYWNLAHLALSQTLNLLSGGEKTKVFLAAIMIHSPGIILLDEPSNHLDSTSRTLLYDFVRTNKATILMVSHDRGLLNLVDTTLELSKGRIEVYGGNYDFFKEQKVGKLKALQAQVDEIAKSLKLTRQKARNVAEQRQKQESRGKAQGQKQSLPRIIAGGRKSQAEQSTAKLKDVQADKINDISDNLQQVRAQLHDFQSLKIDFRKSSLHKGKILIDAKEINFEYGGQSLWQFPVSFQVRSGDRIRIEGNNGSGKTTLLNLIIGKLKPSVGELTIADFTYAYVDQTYSLVENQLTVVEQVQRFNTRHLLEHELKMMLHYYQFHRESWGRKCDELSGGEKMKLTLCCLAIGTTSPDLLILDEPTNNLDIQSQDVLTMAVKNFTGSELVISHDQHFIDELKPASTISL